MLEGQPLVTPEWLHAHLEDPDLVVVDSRFELADPAAGKEAYRQDHIPGARYMDLEEDLSGPVKKHGGRHPLPDLDEFVEKLGTVGIDGAKTVIAYDDQGGAMAARFWWMLRYLGHEEVAILDGGYRAWKERGYPVTGEIPQPVPCRFQPRIDRPEQLAGMEDVKHYSGLVIDSRDPDRFEGKTEPIDAKAGHIPGAVNRFWKKNLCEDGRWKRPSELKKEWAFASRGEAPIVYCGSGVTACANLLALHAAGFKNARLYAGSWSDWISYEANPVRTGKTNH
ncbi:thiosulfate/3-mercaptopyruvate sulfurtransferase [Melghirimyces profundicolus]|uniref:Thiosulfate/3-mercaptopyruvate sulfurtransferase n=1 Tax=Melghirimyces profundicolus TaxID=1242148 RepID=A0A2T6C7M3_9BACL|nr:sulfurtransferase [Melghirimyces profundicolus]PTX64310.1 thiosulfate/3-mercaptopyruvate sulfurtransferase [Melghirimyces profundicolus]